MADNDVVDENAGNDNKDQHVAKEEKDAMFREPHAAHGQGLATFIKQKSKKALFTTTTVWCVQLRYTERKMRPPTHVRVKLDLMDKIIGIETREKKSGKKQFFNP